MDEEPEETGGKSLNESAQADKKEDRESVKKVGRPRKKNRWPMTIFFITLCLSTFISFMADAFIEPAGLLVALVVLFFLMLFGIMADIVGVAVTSCATPPLASMAARKVPGARQALWLAQNADRMSNILNDVVGDVCSVISGTAATAVSLRLLAITGGSGADSTMMGVLVSGFVAAITVGGKALGKSFAITQAKSVVLIAGRVMSFFSGLTRVFARKTGPTKSGARRK